MKSSIFSNIPLTTCAFNRHHIKETNEIDDREFARENKKLIDRAAKHQSQQEENQDQDQDQDRDTEKLKADSAQNKRLYKSDANPDLNPDLDPNYSQLE